MTRLGKPFVLLFLLALAALSAAVFGAAHNQLSYSVGPGYFHDLKFAQFAIHADMAPRLGAAWVGVQASWWMGIAVALPACLFGFFTVPRAESFLAAGIGAIGLVIIFTTFAAFTGLIGGLVADTTGLLDPFLSFPEGPSSSDFLRAGFMHDASYIGGALGALIAFFPMRRAARIDTARHHAAQGDPDA